MDLERFPLLTPETARRLSWLRQHPHAPVWTYHAGERLLSQDLVELRLFAANLAKRSSSWLPAHLAFCRDRVPFYRARGVDTPVSREDLAREPWSFVPDGAPLDRLVTYTTSGTTGTRLLIPAHPLLPNKYLPLLEWALARRGVTLAHGPETTVMVHVCAQLRTYTLPSVVSYFGGAGYAKINLNASEWRAPEDPVRFLDDLAPQLVTGDPFSLARYAELPLAHAPRALVSTGTALTPGQAAALRKRFGVAVLDLYSSNETGPIAVRDGDGPHELLPHELDVALVNGEVCVTGALNPMLPLVRYRTGDFAERVADGRIHGLHGRAPVTFGTHRGRVNSIDVATLLADLPLATLRVEQSASGALSVRAYADEAALEKARMRLADFFGPDVPLTVTRDTALVQDGKRITFASEQT